MNDLIQFLKSQKFKTEANIELLKVTVSKVKHEDRNTDIQSPDLRYFWDGEAFGLHISNSKLNQNELLKLMVLIEENKAILSILYIGNTNLSSIQLKDYENLTFLHLSKNKNLGSVTLNNCPKLQKIHASHCPKLANVELKGSFQQLESIDVSFSEKLSQFTFPQAFPKLRFFHAINTGLESDYIGLGQQFFEGELQQQLKSFLKLRGLLQNINTIQPNRYQVIFIGNTTAGKTELRLALTNEQRNPGEPISTHGVHVFTHSLGDKEIFGYDFGGQDYYHATHLPFFDDKTLYVLVWGNFHEWNWGSGDPDEFGLKTELVENTTVENILYPLNYWLGSLLYNNGSNKPTTEETTEHTTSKTKRNLEIIQNLRAENSARFYLNTKALKAHPLLDIGDMVDFDIFKDKKKAADWLVNRIKDRNLIDTQPVLEVTYEFGKKLMSEPKAFYSQTELIQKFEAEDSVGSGVEFNAIAQTLHINRLGFWHREVKDYFIARIDLFSKHIYEILSKELAVNEQTAGYFSADDAKKRTNLKQEEVKFILDFLESENVIFKVVTTEKYVAPAYLPTPKNKADELLLASFDAPDCYWDFEGYFHSNIILQIIVDKKGNLIYDATRNEYLLWKNTILIYTNPQADKRLQEYLLIKLEYPNAQNKLTKPRLSLSRNKAKYVNDADFRKYFEYLNQKLNVFQDVKTWVKTPYEQEGIPKYIPFDVILECDKAQSGKNAHLVYYEHTFFNRFDFKHFKEMSSAMPKRVFVAYSKSDDDLRAELRNHLRPYEKSGELIVFDDRDLELGSVWDAELKKQLIDCDIFVCLVSINVLNTPYVVDLEIPEAKRLNKHIIPVILSPCNWQESRYGLADYSASSKGQAISLYYKDFGLYNQSLQSLEKFERAERWTELVKRILEVAKK